jgi:hypothetical protein
MTIENMETIWLVTSEILVEPGDLPSGATKAFVNVTTWADSIDSIKEKLSRYLNTHKWHLISIEKAHPIDETHDYGEEIEDMIERTRANPEAIILGKFNSYKEN